ncbi:MAG: flagellar hook-length control protein FliK [Gammaproteobacteria bacterium]|nr:flagellar hook-length control protein FliK [Gammaproteobacteria bacterium]
MVKLNPANLGPVEVKLNMHSDQANVLFISHNAATRDALEQALPRLREAFEQNGMQLADADVTGQESDQADDEQAGEGGILDGKGELSTSCSGK